MTEDTSDADDADDGWVRYDWRTAESPSAAVTRAVAVVNDRAASALPPLYETVDPEALDALVTRDGSLPVTVAFSHAGRDVRVHSDGTVLVSTA